jgi:hypothetical protein
MFRVVFWVILPCKMIVDWRFRGMYCLHHQGSLMMEAVRTSETSVDNHFTWQYNPEDNSEHHTRSRENLKSHIVNLYGEATLRCIRRFESHSFLMMEAVRTSETSVDNHFTRQYNPEDNSEHHTRRRENLKSHVLFNLFQHVLSNEFPNCLS